MKTFLYFWEQYCGGKKHIHLIFIQISESQLKSSLVFSKHEFMFFSKTVFLCVGRGWTADDDSTQRISSKSFNRWMHVGSWGFKRDCGEHLQEPACSDSFSNSCGEQMLIHTSDVWLDTHSHTCRSAYDQTDTKKRLEAKGRRGKVVGALSVGTAQSKNERSGTWVRRVCFHAAAMTRMTV